MKKIITEDCICFLDENRLKLIWGCKDRRSGYYKINIDYANKDNSLVLLSYLSEDDYFESMRQLRNFVSSEEEILYLCCYEKDD